MTAPKKVQYPNLRAMATDFMCAGYVEGFGIAFLQRFNGARRNPVDSHCEFGVFSP